MKRHLNIALKQAIVGSGKKQQRIASLARMTPVELSKVVRGFRPAKENEKEKLASILDKSIDELFPDQVGA